LLIIKFISRSLLVVFMYDYIELLMHITKKGLFDTVKTSTLKIASELDVSQQTISRDLREMEKLGLIKREATPNGISIVLDDKGRDFLKKHFEELNKVFEKKKELNGSVTTGVGEGRYYVGLNGYQKQFQRKLGFRAYPGTLNLIVAQKDALSFLSSLKIIEVSDFKTKKRTYGSLKCYKVKINDINGAVVVPERARHGKEVMELIAPVYLRCKLGLKDKDKVKLGIV